MNVESYVTSCMSSFTIHWRFQTWASPGIVWVKSGQLYLLLNTILSRSTAHVTCPDNLAALKMPLPPSHTPSYLQTTLQNLTSTGTNQKKNLCKSELVLLHMHKRLSTLNFDFSKCKGDIGTIKISFPCKIKPGGKFVQQLN